MNQNQEMKENLETGKKNNNLFPIIAGVSALIIIVVAITVGFWYKGKTPDKIFENAITSLAEKLIKNIDKDMPSSIDFATQDFLIDGTVQFDTNIDLEDYEFLKDYSYQVQLGMSLPKKIINMNASLADLNKPNEKIIEAKVSLQNNKGYLNVPGVLPTPIVLEDYEWPSEMEQYEQIKINKEDYKVIVQAMKEAIITSFDKNKLTVNDNIKDDYNGKEAITKEYVYHIRLCVD